MDILEKYLQEMVEKIGNGTEIDRDDLSELIGYSQVVYTGENRRWLRTVKSVFEFNGRYFMIEWEEPLTEMQEKEFYHQPYEVRKIVSQKIIEVVEYKKL